MLKKRNNKTAKGTQNVNPTYKYSFTLKILNIYTYLYVYIYIWKRLVPWYRISSWRSAHYFSVSIFQVVKFAVSSKYLGRVTKYMSNAIQYLFFLIFHFVLPYIFIFFTCPLKTRSSAILFLELRVHWRHKKWNLFYQVSLNWLV